MLRKCEVRSAKREASKFEVRSAKREVVHNEYKLKEKL